MPGPAMEGRCDRPAGVAGSRHQDVHQRILRLAQTLETGREETGAEILEGRSRAMEELEDQQSCSSAAVPLHTRAGAPES
jgi:hypothetical protein